jgi:hypothetical protein
MAQHGGSKTDGIVCFCPQANLPGFSLLVFCFGGSRGQKAGKNKKVASGKFRAKKKFIAKKYYDF